MINWNIPLVENKYSRWYEKLIKKAKERQSVIGYKETHHIIPVSLLGTNSKDNLVELTAREHYIAHLLLWKMDMTPKDHNKMTMALNIMINGSGHKKQDRSYIVNSRLYESHRKEYSAYLSESQKGSNNSFWGEKHTLEAIEKIKEANKRTRASRSEKLTGEKNPMYGKKHSEEKKKQISESVSKSWSDEDRKQKSEWAKKKWQDAEYREYMLKVRSTSEAWMNRDWSSANKKAAATRKANGYIMSEDTKKKISASRRARIESGTFVSWNKGKKLPQISGENSPTAKTWQIISPTGIGYSGKGQTKLHEVCKTLGIGFWSMLELLKGKKGKNHLFVAGWKASYIQF